MSKRQGIVPLYILKRLAEEGNEEAKESVRQTKETHEKRAFGEVGIYSLVVV